MLMVGMASRFYHGTNSACPAYFYRADGSISCEPDGSNGRTFGRRLNENSFVTVRLDFSDWSLAFAVDGQWQGSAFKFSTMEEPEPLFPVVVFGAAGEAVHLRPPTLSVALGFGAL